MFYHGSTKWTKGITGEEAGHHSRLYVKVFHGIAQHGSPACGAVFRRDDQNFSFGCVKAVTSKNVLDLNSSDEYSLCMSSTIPDTRDTVMNKDPGLKELSFWWRRHMSIIKE